MIKYLFVAIGLIAIGCSPSYKKTLEKQMVENPKTQDDIDQNIILAYVLANGLTVEKTSSGIYYTITEDGFGELKPGKNADIKAHYKGYLTDGSVFDSSYDRNEPLQFKLGQVIKGWQESIQMMKKGGKGTFLIPSRLGYGINGAGAIIPPNSVLIFEIELLDFKTQT